MIQPFDGFWELPEEGLVIYDWKKQEGQKLDDNGLDFRIEGFGHQLFLLCPINNDWAVIGRPDKYLSPSTVDIAHIGEASITLEFAEMGPVIFIFRQREIKLG